MRINEKSIHECDLCVYVANGEFVVIPKEIKETVGYQPVFIGFFTMPGWAGHLPFFAFRCRYCDCPSADYPHGYTEGGRLFLSCNGCEEVLVLNKSEHKHIYKMEGLKPPAGFFATLLSLIRFKRKLKG